MYQCFSIWKMVGCESLVPGRPAHVHVESKMDIATHCNPGSLTHWKRWYPSLFSSLKMTPFYAAKHRLFGSKWPIFHDKALTFQSKMNPTFWCKTQTFEPKWTPFFHDKTLNIKINPFFSKFKEVSTKIPLFF